MFFLNTTVVIFPLTNSERWRAQNQPTPWASVIKLLTFISVDFSRDECAASTANRIFPTFSWGRRNCATIKSGQERVRPDVEWGLKCVPLTKRGHSWIKEWTLVGGKMTPTAFSLHRRLRYLLCVSLQKYYPNAMMVGAEGRQLEFQTQTSQMCSKDLESISAKDK